ncbi:hypothetical protein [Shewanella maritima]|uniref:hypothetical protein n=1 Tax=Shewanella maritima TaxID=2520507 RepID=UPI003735F13B
MKYYVPVYTCCLLSMLTLLSPVAAQEKDTIEPIKSKVGNIVVISNPIFDLSDPETFFIHEWANLLHINTLETTTLNNLPFEEGDDVTDNEIAEAQRLLRQEAYIRDASISISEVDDPDADADTGKQVIVETWDNWSLLPILDFSSSGGETKYSIGVKEDNLLGLGVKTRLKYQSDADRSGYKFSISTPVYFIKHAKLSIDLLDNSDGELTQVRFTNPFYSLNSPYMYSFNVKQETRVDTVRQNGNDVNEFVHDIEYADVRFGWLANKTESDLHRFTVGVTQDKHTFDNTLIYPDGELPRDRDFLYPWLGYEYIEDDYEVLRNIYVISKNEDFNLGWYHSLKFGLETQDVSPDSDLGYHFNFYSSKGYSHDEHLVLLKLSGQMTLNTLQDDFYNVSAQAEYFYQFSEKWKGYLKGVAATSQNNYIDHTFALGDNTGLRGYPNDYQHGDNQWLLTAELRNYPNFNLYQLADLGWVVFTDVGHAYGGPDENNEVDSPLGSVGVGARIYSSKSSYSSVAHIDLAVPFTQGEGTNDWEFRFQVKNHF